MGDSQKQYGSQLCAQLQLRRRAGTVGRRGRQWTGWAVQSVRMRRWKRRLQLALKLSLLSLLLLLLLLLLQLQL